MPEVAGPHRLRQLLDAVLTIGSDLDLEAMLNRIIQAAVDLVDARYGALGVLDATGTRLAQFITVGIDEEERQAIGALPRGHGILGLLIIDAKPLRLPDIDEHPDSYGFPENHPPMTSFLGVPIRVRNKVFGNLYLTDKTRAEVFTDVDEELVVGLAAAAGVAIENARLHTQVQELTLFEDRERIAQDLHDTIIQRLFATGMGLQAAVQLIERPEVAARIERAVDDLDLTVKHIRSTIFGLTLPGPEAPTLRGRILQVGEQAAPALGFRPAVSFDGPVDSGLDDAVGEDLLPTLREALSNVARHAHATRVEIEVNVGDDFVLTVTDNGVGLPSGKKFGGNGLTNMEARARRRGGRFSIEAGPGGGTRLTWQVPPN